MEVILIGVNGALVVVPVKMMLSKLENVTVQPQHVEEMIVNQPLQQWQMEQALP